VAIYEAANRTWSSVKVIVIYTVAEQEKVDKIVRELGLQGTESIVLIDARSDNKPSASKACASGHPARSSAPPARGTEPWVPGCREN
jgi:hypothetical protein